MTRKEIEDMREVVLPYVKKRLLEINYENLGESDAEEFTRDFNEILDLAIKALEQEPILDKVRTEIESKLDNINRLYNQDNQYDDGAIDSLQYALDIIDKYRESEDKE